MAAWCAVASAPETSQQVIAAQRIRELQDIYLLQRDLFRKTGSYFCG